ncbi:MAG: cytochrome c oxidase assembly protein [Thermoleophilaceae bacterium]|nr:cytochrome c oxidase assembly protein [Thermoleophilaceae bacterium]
MVVFDPGVIAVLAISIGLYQRAVRVLGRRGYQVPRGQQACWYAGVACLAVGLLGPPDALADELFTAHMGEHLLIADIGGPLLLFGMRTPVLVFLLPRQLLVPLARFHALRRVFRFARRPLVAIPIFMVVLYGWHLAAPFDAALRHDSLHALQHISFVGASMLVWWSAIEPQRRHMPGELWKIGYILGARLVSMFLAMALIFSRSPWYHAYGDLPREHGFSPLTDQQVGGGMMLGLDLLVMMFALSFFFWSAAREQDRLDEQQRQAAKPAPTA